MWGRTLVDAKRFLGRWCDDFTRDCRDDLAQETAFAAWRRIHAQRDLTRFPAVVRTIARRLRMRALQLSRRCGTFVADGELEDWPVPAEGTAACLRVRGVPVPRDWLLECLGAVLPTLSPLNQHLLLTFYQGVTCRELGRRFGLSEDAVKVRLHRSRCVLRRRLEAAACAAGHFDP